MDSIVNANALSFKRMIERTNSNNIELPGDVTIIKEEKEQKAYIDSAVCFNYSDGKIIFLAHWKTENNEIIYIELENKNIPDGWIHNYGFFQKMKKN